MGSTRRLRCVTALGLSVLGVVGCVLWFSGIDIHGMEFLFSPPSHFWGRIDIMGRGKTGGGVLRSSCVGCIG